MKDFYTIKYSYAECQSEDFCTCSVCARNCVNGGGCSRCSGCSYGNKQEEEEQSCFQAMRTLTVAKA